MAEVVETQEKLNKEKQKKTPYISRYRYRNKKRQWENDDNTDEFIEEKRANFHPTDRIKKKKCVILLGYSGVNYFGMQRNPGMKTIEEDLFAAMLKNKWIDEDGFNQAQSVQFQRAARTDKGVSAARQCCSIKLPENVDINCLNSDLPEQIRVFAVKRVTKGFNSKDQCSARTYTYTLPTISFADYSEIVDMTSYRVTKEKINRFNKILRLFEGTKNFHNFTSRKEYMDPASKRYIMFFTCDEPFLSPDGIEFATIKIKGQSFMMHQIRKMVGLALAVVRAHTKEDTIIKSFTEERLDLPMAPGLGLALDRVHYDKYDRRYGDDGIHEPLTFEKEECQIQEFVRKFIDSNIFETEAKEKSMVSWLETLHLHTYDVRYNDKKCELKDDNLERVDDE